ncbi:TPA: hypothetical protein LY322_001682 [Enterococcus faecium]|nr:hypothetical protein [Enterococcus faecium]
MEHLSDCFGKMKIATTSCAREYFKDDLDKSEYSCFVDSRAAMFFAMGQALAKRRNVVVMLADELTSCYTALTECAFQQVDLIVFAFQTVRHEIDLASLKNCGCNLINCSAQDDIDRVVSNTKGLNQTTVIKINMNCESDKDHICEYIDLPDIPVFFHGSLYSPASKKKYEQYGQVSKYLGYLVGGKDAILIISHNEFLNDISVWINYYSFGEIQPKIIIFDSPNDYQYKWLCDLECSVAHSTNRFLSEDLALLQNNGISIVLRGDNYDIVS